jgi:hypothetical protein
MRDLVVGTNLTALPVVMRAKHVPVAVMLFLSMCASFVFHATVDEEVMTIWGYPKRHGLDECLLFAFPSPELDYFRRHGFEMLVLDQVCALGAILITVWYHGLPRLRPTIIALGFLFLSENSEGLQHAIFHSMWHAIAFGIVGELIDE